MNRSLLRPLRSLSLRALLGGAALLTLLAPGVAARAADSIDVNVASALELEQLPGVGAKIAADIVREREENGPFVSLEDLARVRSVTPSVLGRVRNFITAGAGDSDVAEAAPARGGSASSGAKDVLKSFSSEPTVREVQEAAVSYARVHPDVIDSWRTRARLNALAPKLTTSGQGTIDRDLREVSNLDATSAVVSSKNDNNQGRVTVQLAWDLDRLIFEPQEMSVAREGVRMAQLRERVLDDVTRRYFERRRLQVELKLAPSQDLADRLRKELRLQELTADLDAVTGGWFGQKLQDAGKAPY